MMSGAGNHMDAKKWSVCVMRGDELVELGEVSERCEATARRTALQRFGVADYQLEVEGVRPRGAAIYPDERFEVQIAS